MKGGMGVWVSEKYVPSGGCSPQGPSSHWAVGFCVTARLWVSGRRTVCAGWWRAVCVAVAVRECWA